MKDRSEKRTGPPKKPYIKPEIRRVLLRPEEAVLGGCKNTGQMGPSGADCGIPLNCSTAAS
jgi:hypothetical protein